MNKLDFKNSSKNNSDDSLKDVLLNETENKSEDIENNNLAWSPNIDILLSKWCDNAKCYEWMHTKSFDLYNRKARIFMISINILTTLSGLSNVIAGGYSFDGFQIAWIFGSISIIVSTLNILQDKLGYQQLADTHKRLSNEWAIIRNRIEEIIVVPPNARKDCKTFLKYIRTDVNNAMLDKNASIPQTIRDECLEKFKNIPNFDIPEICGQIEHTQIYIQK
jgi:phage pi2 protein 07